MVYSFICKMKRALLILFIIAFLGCERDDICIDSVTPNLVIRLYDFENNTRLKPVNNLKVTISGNQNEFIYSGDSLALPIRVDIDNTRYILKNKISETETLVDTIDITYKRENIFIGRSCGFKTIFKDIRYTRTSNWIKTFQAQNTITNEVASHVQISY